MFQILQQNDKFIIRFRQSFFLFDSLSKHHIDQYFNYFLLNDYKKNGLLGVHFKSILYILTRENQTLSNKGNFIRANRVSLFDTMHVLMLAVCTRRTV